MRAGVATVRERSALNVVVVAAEKRGRAARVGHERARFVVVLAQVESHKLVDVAVAAIALVPSSHRRAAGRARVGGFVCIVSPRTRSSMTTLSSSTAATSRSRASETDAREQEVAREDRDLVAKGRVDRRRRGVADLSITSSWKSEAVWIISAISASRRCAASTVRGLHVRATRPSRARAQAAPLRRLRSRSRPRHRRCMRTPSAAPSSDGSSCRRRD